MIKVKIEHRLTEECTKFRNVHKHVKELKEAHMISLDQDYEKRKKPRQ